MISIIKADGTKEYEFLNLLGKRSGEVGSEVDKSVAAIIEDVKQNKDSALRKYNELFDGCTRQAIEVSRDEINDALSNADEAFVNALLNAQENIADFHRRQLPQGFSVNKDNGVILGQRVRGLNRVGVYVPGGTAAYPSSVLMNVIPAKIAGVNEIVMVTPPSKNGSVNQDILVAAAIAGVDKVFLTGGAQAVAALCFGTESVPKVDKIVGPGNIYVATAKKMLFGNVDIDMIAGPSEILIMADKNANPKYIAADLMSQAEHDVLAGALLLTDDTTMADRVLAELKAQSAALERKDIIEKALKDFGGIIVCRNTDEMVALANLIAPEHLEVMLEDPMRYVGRLNNAGSLFLGDYSPEPLGDYYAGPNHVLPTNGTARFFSPLSVDSFLKRTSYTYYTKEALNEAHDDIVLIANREGLTAHANSIIVRKD